MGKATFTITFEDGETASQSIYILDPEFVDSWWSLDEEGKEVYHYGDILEEKTSIPLGTTVYFHVKTKDIPAGRELEMQLMDYDTYCWMGEQIDELKSDDSKFPNQPVWKKAKVRVVDGESIATVDLKLDEEWEVMIKDEKETFAPTQGKDTTIELYWRVRYANKNGIQYKAILPKSKKDYLRVGHSTRDLYLKPITGGIGLPEFYDNTGKLIIFSFKQVAKISKAINPEPYLSSLHISTIRITNTRTLSEINEVKRVTLYERVYWDNNKSVRFGYTTKESSNFIVKSGGVVEDLVEFELKEAKKFSDYFKRDTLSNAGHKGIQLGRKALKILDFINATKTVTSIFKAPEEGLQIPKPSSVISAMGLVSTISKIPQFGALSPLFMAGDVISTKVVNEILNEFTEDSLLAWEQMKASGLKNALAFVQHSQGARMLGLDVIEYVNEKTYCKLLNNEFETFADFEEFLLNEERDGHESNWYTFFYYEKKENKKTKYLIDSIFIRE